MKLHLPLGLRRAVLVGLVLGGTPAMQASLSTASGLAAATMVSVIMAVQQAHGADEKNVDADETLDGTQVKPDGWTLHFGHEGTPKLTVSGDVQVTGNFRLDGGGGGVPLSVGDEGYGYGAGVVLRQGAEVTGNLSIYDYATLYISAGQRVQAAGLDGWDGSIAVENLRGEATLELNVTGGSVEARSYVIGQGVTLIKKGEGTQIFSADYAPQKRSTRIDGKIVIESGKIQINNHNSSQGEKQFRLGDIEVQAGGTLYFSGGAGQDFGVGKGEVNGDVTIAANGDQRALLDFSHGEYVFHGRLQVDGQVSGAGNGDGGVKLRDSAKLTLEGEINGSGDITLFGGDLVLRRGGRIGRLIMGWGTTVRPYLIELGGDLEVTNGFVHAGGTSTFQITSEESVYLIYDTTEIEKTHQLNSHFSLTGQVGLRQKGTANALVLHDGTEIAGGLDIEHMVKLSRASITVHGIVSGGGTLQVFGTSTQPYNAVANLKQGGEIGTLDASWGAVIELGGDLIIHNWEFNNGSHHLRFTRDADVSDPVYLVLDNTRVVTNDKGDDNEEVINCLTEKGGYLEFENVGVKKAGENTLTLAANGHQWNIGGNLAVQAGTLVLQDTTTVNGEVIVTGGTLHVRSELNINGAKVTLNGNGATYMFDLGDRTLASVSLDAGGKLKSNLTQESGGAAHTMSELTMGNGSGSLEFSSGVTGGYERFVVTTLKGGGGGSRLDIIGGDTLGGSSASYRSVYIETFDGYSGTISGDFGAGTYNRLRVGSVEVGDHSQVTLSITGGAGVYSTNFMKTGGGTLNITGKLSIGGLGENSTIRMTYTGTLNIGSVVMASNSKLVYDGTDYHANRVVEWDWAAQFIGGLESMGEYTLKMQNFDVRATKRGIRLGIIGDAAWDLEQLREKFSVEGMQEWSLQWKRRNDRYELWITAADVTTEMDFGWDIAWDDVGAAPDRDTMRHAAFKEDLPGAGEFNDQVLELAQNDNYRDATTSYVALTKGGGEKAAVLGGRVYEEGQRYTREEMHLSLDSYIYIEPGDKLGGDKEELRFHIVVGGSSCLSTDPSGQGAGLRGMFEGNTHIQMMGGDVDYVIGGNHVNNSSLGFSGDTWISVVEGQIKGGIAGGSTLTRGAADMSVHTFDAGEHGEGSHIHIYCVLGNEGLPPGLSDGSGTAGDGKGFAAVVGGNVWINTEVQSASAGMHPSFHANSEIIINLVDALTLGGEEHNFENRHGQFEKDIVGGNYTAIITGQKSEDSTLFAGDSRIVIKADTARDTFIGSITGASRQASGGEGSMEFTGNTHITIDGGKYKAEIAGGLRFDSTANGNHSGTLAGNTTVTLQSGEFWRVAGGSYSLSGGSGAHENTTGSSCVEVTGGAFASSALQPSRRQVGFVCGGSYYSGNGGTHQRTGNSRLEVRGGQFGLGVLLLGGDYTDYSGGLGNPSVSVDGVCSMAIGGKAAVNGGSIVGGSFLIDTGRGGSVTADATKVSVTNGSITAMTQESARGQIHGCVGVAVVGGHMIIDEGTDAGNTGGHTAQVTTKTTVEVKGGSISGAVVGGSYISQTSGSNTAVAGSVQMDLTAGNITGNIYGGHYSCSTTAPDQLSLGNVVIDVTGNVRIEGDIVGGSYREDVSDAGSSPHQGSIIIKLHSGTLQGNVHAAGYHVGENPNGLNIATESVEVQVSEHFCFEETCVVSGGYRKDGTGTDNSKLINGSTLNFTAQSGSYTNLGRVSFRDFSKVANDVDVKIARDFGVLQGADGTDNFNKAGRGKLVLEHGLKDHAGLPYRGAIGVENGVLVVGGETDQSIAGGLTLDLTGRSEVDFKTKEGALLQRNGEGEFSLNVGEKCKLMITVGREQQLSLGTYYLVSGLADNISDVDAWFKDFQGSLTTIKNALGSMSGSCKVELLITEGCLTLSIRETSLARWEWEGRTNSGEAMVWKDSSASNWNQQEADLQHQQQPAGKDLFFLGSGTGIVQIENSVTPTSVHVEAGEYVFTQKSGTGGLNMSGAEAALFIGGGDTKAKLTLRLANSAIPKVKLLDNGVLVLDHSDALPMGNCCIEMSGGMLSYADGITTDVSSLISKSSSCAVTIEVQGGQDHVSWGDVSRAADDGVLLGLTKGVIKTGTGDLVLKWRAKDTTEYTDSSYDIEDGQLTLATEIFEGKSVKTGLQGANIASGSTLVLQNSGKGTLELAGEKRGDGTLVLGAATGADGNYALSGSTNVAQVKLLSGNVWIYGVDSLGGNDTVLTLDGGGVSAAMDASVRAKMIMVEKDTLFAGSGKITITGSLCTTKGDSIKMSAKTNMLLDVGSDISAYRGELAIASGKSWTIRNARLTDYQFSNRLSGAGVVIFEAYTEDIVLSGTINDSVSVKNCITGHQVIITGEDNTSTGELHAVGGNIQIGTENQRAKWCGHGLGGGREIILVNCDLNDGGITSKGDAKLKVSTGATKATTVNLGGTSGNMLDEIVIHEGGKITGVKGNINVGSRRGNTRLQLHFTSSNAGSLSTGAGKSFLINGTNVQLEVGDLGNDWENFQLVFDNTAFMEALKAGVSGGSIWLHIVNGKLIGLDDHLSELMVRQGGNARLLGLLNMQARSVSNGSIEVSGSAQDVYLVTDDNRSNEALVDSFGVFAKKKAVVVDAGQRLTLALDGAAEDAPHEKKEVLRNLVGLNGSELVVINAAGGDQGEHRITVELSNQFEEVIDDWRGEDGIPGASDGSTIHGQDTLFEGTIRCGMGVDLVKSGAGTLSVGANFGQSGGLLMEDGLVELGAGRLVLQGRENRIHELNFAYEEGGKADGNEEERGLVLRYGSTFIESINENGSNVEGQIIAVEAGAHLWIIGENTLCSTSITGDGTGTLSLAGEGTDHGREGGKLTLSGSGIRGGVSSGEKVVLCGVNVDIRNGGELTLSDGGVMRACDVKIDSEGKFSLGGDAKIVESAVYLEQSAVLDTSNSTGNALTILNGSGTLKSAEGGEVSVSGETAESTFSGTLAATLQGSAAGKLIIRHGSKLTLDNVTTVAEEKWQLRNEGKLVVDISRAADQNMTVGDVFLAEGSATTYRLNTDTDGKWEMDNLTVEGPAKFTIDSNGMRDVHAGELSLGYVHGVCSGLENLELELLGAAFFHLNAKGLGVRDGQLTLLTDESEQNKLTAALPNCEKNVRAGAVLFWSASSSHARSWQQAMDNWQYSDLFKVVNNLSVMVASGDTTELAHALAAGAGSSISTLGPALAEDLHRQLKVIRNRTTTMAGEVTYDAYDNLPIWHAWINSEGGYHKLDSDGYAPGYTLNNWGGTVGVDIDVTPQTTMGLAITAMYGDLKPSAADGATGNLDTAYLSAFLRATSGAWIHTFVVSGGLADAQLDRTVNYGAGNYRTQGSTDGYAVGAMYEVGYTRLVNKEGTMALQPVFNVEVRHASIKGYNETGSDAGLSVDDIGQDVMTFGMGARMQSIVGENAFNRTSIFEARLLVKADAGDRSGTAMNAILHDTTRAEVESAEVGAVGVEAGMGITIPLGSSSGSIFLDASVEWRKGWTSVDAAAGYRVNF